MVYNSTSIPAITFPVFILHFFVENLQSTFVCVFVIAKSHSACCYAMLSHISLTLDLNTVCLVQHQMSRHRRKANVNNLFIVIMQLP